ncbi:MAG: RNA methyltransferase [Planctomycetes bacterium]|nr:RNA methyltransferase [Planctomycetota bacterium]
MARHPDDNLIVVYGWFAARAVLARRMADVARIHYAPDRLQALKPFLKEAARRRLVYRQNSLDELTRVARSEHHEGIAVACRPAAQPSIDDLLRRGPRLVTLLEWVENPHNLGAILRTAAFFGCDALIVERGGGADLSPATMRTAEGGAESIPCLAVESVAAVAARLRAAGHALYGADPRGGVSLFDLAPRFPCALALGNERRGLSPALRAACDALVRIPGPGPGPAVAASQAPAGRGGRERGGSRATGGASGPPVLDSLNVSVAAGVFLATLAARSGAGAAGPGTHEPFSPGATRTEVVPHVRPPPAAQRAAYRDAPPPRG